MPRFIERYCPSGDYLFVGADDGSTIALVQAHRIGLELRTNAYSRFMRRHLLPGQYSVSAIAEFIAAHTGYHSSTTDRAAFARAFHRRVARMRHRLLDTGIWEQRGVLSWKRMPTDFFEQVSPRAFVLGDPRSYRAWWARFCSNIGLAQALDLPRDVSASGADRSYRALCHAAVRAHQRARRLPYPHRLYGWTSGLVDFLSSEPRDLAAVFTRDPAWKMFVDRYGTHKAGLPRIDDWKRLLHFFPATCDSASPALQARVFGCFERRAFDDGQTAHTYGLITNADLHAFLDARQRLLHAIYVPLLPRGILRMKVPLPAPMRWADRDIYLSHEHHEMANLGHLRLAVLPQAQAA
jgi:hypothetical protein